jgi:hypothetical protein
MDQYCAATECSLSGGGLNRGEADIASTSECLRGLMNGCHRAAAQCLTSTAASALCGGPAKHWRRAKDSARGLRMAARRALKLTGEWCSSIARKAPHALHQRRDKEKPQTEASSSETAVI